MFLLFFLDGNKSKEAIKYLPLFFFCFFAVFMIYDIFMDVARKYLSDNKESPRLFFWDDFMSTYINIYVKLKEREKLCQLKKSIQLQLLKTKLKASNKVYKNYTTCIEHGGEEALGKGNRIVISEHEQSETLLRESFLVKTEIKIYVSQFKLHYVYTTYINMY